MSVKATTRILFGLIVMVLVVTGVAIFALVRGESTRDTQNTFIQQSPCTLDPASRECQQVKAESDRERTVKDSCIPFKKVLTNEAYYQITRCPRKGVVAQNSPTASQPSGPPSGGSPSVPNSPSTPAPSTPPKTGTPSEPNPPSQPSEPTAPTPEPPAPAPAKPLIDLTPVTTPVCSITTSLAKIC